MLSIDSPTDEDDDRFLSGGGSFPELFDLPMSIATYSPPRFMMFAALKSAYSIPSDRSSSTIALMRNLSRTVLISWYFCSINAAKRRCFFGFCVPGGNSRSRRISASSRMRVYSIILSTSPCASASSGSFSTLTPAALSPWMSENTDVTSSASSGESGVNRSMTIP